MDGDSYLLELLRYIHLNPLETGIVDKLNKYTWSSHKGYLTAAKEWDWLHKDFILSLFSKTKAESIRIYQRFVSNKTHEEVPESRFLAPDVTKIIEEVCKYYKVTRADNRWLQVNSETTCRMATGANSSCVSING